MSKQALRRLGIALVALVVVVAIVFLVRYLGGKGSGVPGGPVIVVVPEADPNGGGAGATTTTVNDYTGWYAGCEPTPGALPVVAVKVAKSGIPGRYGASYGAESIVVTLVPTPSKPYPFPLNASNAFEADTIVMELDTGAKYTIDFTTKPGKPSWKRGTAIYPYNGQMAWHDWSEDMYGHMKPLTVTDSANPNVSVDVADIKEVRIRYHKPKGAPVCK